MLGGSSRTGAGPEPLLRGSQPKRASGGAMQEAGKWRFPEGRLHEHHKSLGTASTALWERAAQPMR